MVEVRNEKEKRNKSSSARLDFRSIHSWKNVSDLVLTVVVNDPSPMIKSAIVNGIEDDDLFIFLRIDSGEIKRPQKRFEYFRKCWGRFHIFIISKNGSSIERLEVRVLASNCTLDPWALITRFFHVRDIHKSWVTLLHFHTFMPSEFFQTSSSRISSEPFGSSFGCSGAPSCRSFVSSSPTFRLKLMRLVTYFWRSS